MEDLEVHTRAISDYTDEIQELRFWKQIIDASKTNPALHEVLEQAIMIYLLGLQDVKT